MVKLYTILTNALSFKSMKNSNYIFNIVAFALIVFNLLLSSWFVLHGDIMFHTDIARDFLVMNEIVTTHKPTLIGPRAGGMPGVFHGPLWFYVNLPAFMVGNGNPIVVGAFWVFLAALSVTIVYYTGKKLFNHRIGTIAALIYSSFVITYTGAMFNSFGAVMLFPLFFFLMRRYEQTIRVVYLCASLFTLGLVIQFQVGFGPTILILTVLYTLFLTIKKKKIFHLLAFAVLAIPLSSFIVFELRHDFLQIRSALTYIANKHGSGEITFFQLVFNRIQISLLDGLRLVPYSRVFALPVIGLFGWILYTCITKEKTKFRETYNLYFYYYFGFWTLMLLYSGTVWGFFYWAFLPLTILIFASLVDHVNRYVFIPVLLFVLIANIMSGLQFIKGAGNGWAAYHKEAQDVYNDASTQDFGYYVYSPDQFGYSHKYAFIYTQREFPDTKSYPYTKKELTYVSMEPAPPNRPDLDGKWWRMNRVKIQKNPIKLFTYPGGLVIEKFKLTADEMKILHDPNIIQDLTFR